MPKGRVPLPHIDYAANYVRVRVMHPDECQEKSFRTLDPGRPGHTELVICRPEGEETTTTQSLRLSYDDWKSGTQARKLIYDAIKLIKRRYGMSNVCVHGLSEEDKKRFPEFVCPLD